MDDQEWWVNAVKDAKTLSDIEFVFRSLWPGLFPKPFRKPLFDFPDVVIHRATALTGKPYSTKIAPDRNLLQELRDKHGKELEDWWKERFAHTFDCLTQSEARYILKTETFLLQLFDRSSL